MRAVRWPWWSNSLVAAELSLVEPLVRKISALKDNLTGGQLISVFVKRRVQPLHHRVRSMWQYTGPDDLTRCSAKEFTADDLLSWVQQVTKCTSIEEKSLVCPYVVDLPLPQVFDLGSISNFIGICLVVDGVLICRLITLC